MAALITAWGQAQLGRVTHKGCNMVHNISRLIEPHHRVVLVAGATGSGKSALALEIATTCNGVIINCDSMQVYRDLRVLTARPGASEIDRAPHFLYGHVDGAIQYSVADWLKQARATLAQVQSDAALPILVGGTGLYFSALLEGLAEIPPIPQVIRRKWRRYSIVEPELLHEQLTYLDPIAAKRIEPGDRQRSVRALEVIEATGKSIYQWHAASPAPPAVAMADAAALVVAPGRENLVERLQVRLDAMLAGGAIEEVAALLERQIPLDRPVIKAIGVPQIAAHLRGEESFAGARDKILIATRQYAKRQMTWLRNRMDSHWRWLEH